MVWHANSALLAILATVVSVPACADILLKEIGSFHIGGHEAVLSGQPTKEVSFTAGMAPVKVVGRATLSAILENAGLK